MELIKIKNMYYLIESYVDLYVYGDRTVNIEVILKSRNLSELQEYLHSIYLEYLEDADCSINGDEISSYDVENGELPTEYCDKLYVCCSGYWGNEVCRSYQIISSVDLNEVEEL